MTVYKRLESYFIEERKAELLRQANVTAGHIAIGKYMLDDTKKSYFYMKLNKLVKNLNPE